MKKQIIKQVLKNIPISNKVKLSAYKDLVMADLDKDIEKCPAQLGAYNTASAKFWREYKIGEVDLKELESKLTKKMRIKNPRMNITEIKTRVAGLKEIKSQDLQRKDHSTHLQE